MLNLYVAMVSGSDLMCRVVVVETPVKLNEKQKQLMEQLGESFGGKGGEKNTPRSQEFLLDGVKNSFDDLTKIILRYLHS